MYICPVCGYSELEESPYDKFGDSSFEICPCCGTEFGYHDFVKNKKDLTLRWKSLREKWLRKNAKWHFPEKKPKKWSLKEQLKNLKIRKINIF